MQPRAVKVSKYLAKYLRHAPHELGLELQPGGWVLVDDLLTAAEKHGFPISYDELVDCLETNDKQRFAFDVSGEMPNTTSPAFCSLRYASRNPHASMVQPGVLARG